MVCIRTPSNVQSKNGFYVESKQINQTNAILETILLVSFLYYYSAVSKNRG
jgi:hypothetical protein